MATLWRYLKDVKNRINARIAKFRQSMSENSDTILMSRGSNTRSITNSTVDEQPMYSYIEFDIEHKSVVINDVRDRGLDVKIVKK